MAEAKGSLAQLLMLELPESSYGVNPASVHAVKLPFNTADISESKNVISPGTITGRRDPVQPIRGNTDVAGSIVVPIDQCGIGYWLQALLGIPASTATGSAFSHVFTVNSQLTSRVIEKGFTDITAYEKMNGVKVNGMSMEVGGDGELTASFDLIGRESTPGTTTMSSRVTTIVLNRFNQFNAFLQEGGAAISTVRKMTLNVNNNLDTAGYLITSGNTGKRGMLNEGLCTVTGTLECMFENWSYYTLAKSGTERSIELTFQQNSFYLDFLINEAIYAPKSPPISGPEGIWQSLDFQAYYQDASPDKTVLQVTLVNTWAAYSGHL